MIDPVKVCCGKRQSEHSGAMCPDGTVMCCLCFGRFLTHQLATDESGDKIDVCLNCDAHDKFMLELCNWIKAVQDSQ